VRRWTAAAALLAALALGMALGHASAATAWGAEPPVADHSGTPRSAVDPSSPTVDRSSTPSLAASHPSPTLIAFLQSPLGVAATAAGSLGVGAVWIVGSAWHLGRRPQPVRATRGWRRKPVRAEHPPPSAPLDLRVLAGILTAGALLLPIVFSISNHDDVFALPKTGALWATAAATIVVLAISVVRGAAVFRSTTTDQALAMFMVLAIAATILSSDPRHSLIGERLQFQGLITTAAYVALFFGARHALATAGRVRVLSVAVLVAAVIAAVYALAQWFGLDLVWAELYKDRVFSTVGQANALAAILGAGLVLAIGLRPGRSRATLIVLGAIAAVILWALILTFSRGGYVAFVVGVAAAGLVLIGKSGISPTIRAALPRLAAALTVLGLILVLGIAAYAPARDVAGRVVARTVSIVSVTESSNRAHLDLWAVGIRIALDHPLLGTGPDSYVLEFSKYRDDVLPPDRAAVLAQFRPESPHDVYIAIASGMGIPALIAFLVAVGSVLWAAARAARRPLAAADRFAIAGLTGAVALFLVTNVFMTGEPSTSGIFWMALGSLAGIAAAARNVAVPGGNKERPRLGEPGPLEARAEPLARALR
jgi:O-antigen ligase